LPNSRLNAISCEAYIDSISNILKQIPLILKKAAFWMAAKRLLLLRR